MKRKIAKNYFGMTKTQNLILLSMSAIACSLTIFLIILITNNNQLNSFVITLSPTPTIIPLVASIETSTDLSTISNLALVTGITNLPEETILLITVKGGKDDFVGQDKVTVNEGTFESGPFGPDSGLAPGSYVVQVLMPLPKVQPLSVRQIIGENGENLTGNQVVLDTAGVLVIAEEKFEIIQPTVTPIPTPIPTATPIKIPLYGGDIGKQWQNQDRTIALVGVYRTDKINGLQPFGEWNGGFRGGFTQFLVIDLQFTRNSSGFDEYELSNFWLWAYDDESYREYQADIFPPFASKLLKVYYGETIGDTIAFEVKTTSHNFILCYKFGVFIDFSGKITEGCDAYGYQFIFGD